MSSISRRLVSKTLGGLAEGLQTKPSMKVIVRCIDNKSRFSAAREKNSTFRTKKDFRGINFFHPRLKKMKRDIFVDFLPINKFREPLFGKIKQNESFAVTGCLLDLN